MDDGAVVAVEARAEPAARRLVLGRRRRRQRALLGVGHGDALLVGGGGAGHGVVAAAAVGIAARRVHVVRVALGVAAQVQLVVQRAGVGDVAGLGGGAVRVDDGVVVAALQRVRRVVRVRVVVLVGRVQGRVGVGDDAVRHLEGRVAHGGGEAPTTVRVRHGDDGAQSTTERQATRRARSRRRSILKASVRGPSRQGRPPPYGQRYIVRPGR